jgi:serine/threonine-protein kinase HipA
LAKKSLCDAVAEVVPQVQAKMAEIPAFRDSRKRILVAWQEGVDGLRDRRVYSVGKWREGKVFDGISNPPKLKNPKAATGRSPLLGDRSRIK